MQVSGPRIPSFRPLGARAGASLRHKILVAKTVKQPPAAAVYPVPMSDPQPATAQDYAARIARVLAWMQARLGEPMPLTTLAEVAGFSPFHFHRIFRGMVGESVQQYLRRLRLERAAGKLKTSSSSVLDIALDAGYESHEAFTRAFGRQFGCTPTAFRDAQREALPQSPQNFSPMQYSADELQVELRRLPPRLLLCLRHVGPYDQVGSTWERLCDWAGPRDLIGAETEIIGASYDDPDVTPADKLRYDACLTVPPGTKGEGEIFVREFPGGMYASMLHEGPYHELGATYAKLFGGWLPLSGYAAADPPCMEYYLNQPDTTEPEDLLTQVCIPLLRS